MNLKRAIAIVIILIILGGIAYFGIKNSNKSIEILSTTLKTDINTELLQIQAKVKILQDQAIVKNDDNILKGEKLKENEKEEIKEILKDLVEKKILAEDEENFDKYYLWNTELLNELNLSLDSLKKPSDVIVNYGNLEIIIPDGIQFEKDGEIFYKFSEFKENNIYK